VFCPVSRRFGNNAVWTSWVSRAFPETGSSLSCLAYRRASRPVPTFDQTRNSCGTQIQLPGGPPDRSAAPAQGGELGHHPGTMLGTWATPIRPRALACCKPAIVRSLNRTRSCFATAARIPGGPNLRHHVKTVQRAIRPSIAASPLLSTRNICRGLHANDRSPNRGGFAGCLGGHPGIALARTTQMESLRAYSCVRGGLLLKMSDAGLVWGWCLHERCDE
jgi:hypothetical protein